MNKILIATPLYPPDIGGPATYARELVAGLPARGVEVVLLKFSDVRHLPKLIRHYVYYRRLLQELRHADAVLALDPVSVGLPAMRAAKKLGKPLIVKIVGDYAWEQGVQRFGVTQNLDEFVKTPQKNFFVKKLQHLEFKVAMAAVKIIVPSEYLMDIVSAWGVPKENIVIINNAVRIPENLPAQTKEKDFLIVSAGRRVPWKGFEVLERLQKQHPEWQVQILSDKPREEVLGWMKAADVFVLNSTYEGFPHTLVEAMTLGTPVVATTIRANRSLVGNAGMLVPPGDDAALEQALIEIQKNPALARERARAGQERMKQFELEFTLDLSARFFKSL
jgi:glycosyltransferase involved in cell wall biosynthesis